MYAIFLENNVTCNCGAKLKCYVTQHLKDGATKRYYKCFKCFERYSTVETIITINTAETEQEPVIYENYDPEKTVEQLRNVFSYQTITN